VFLPRQVVAELFSSQNVVDEEYVRQLSPWQPCSSFSRGPSRWCVPKICKQRLFKDTSETVGRSSSSCARSSTEILNIPNAMVSRDKHTPEACKNRVRGQPTAKQNFEGKAGKAKRRFNSSYIAETLSKIRRVTCQPANLPTCQPANLPTCQPAIQSSAGRGLAGHRSRARVECRVIISLASDHARYLSPFIPHL
jgi:hypothetical protein